MELTKKAQAIPGIIPVLNVVITVIVSLLFVFPCSAQASGLLLNDRMELLGLNNATPLAFPVSDNENLVIKLPSHWDIRLMAGRSTVIINTRPNRNAGAYVLTVFIQKSDSEQSDIKAMLKNNAGGKGKVGDKANIIQFSEKGYYMEVEQQSGPHSYQVLFGITRIGKAYLIFRFDMVDRITEKSRTRILEIVSSASIVQYKDDLTVHLCDYLGADPQDKQAITTGVSTKIINKGRVIQACSEAVTRQPDNARYHYQLGRAYYLSGKREKAIEQWTDAATKGYPQAQYQLGKLHPRGKLSAEQYKVASEWFQKAANQGHTDSQYRLAVLRYRQKDPHYDINSYVKALSALSKNGHAKAQYSLGSLYNRGEVAKGTPEDAVYWLRMAAAQDSGSAQYKLGLLYEEGKGVEANLAEAVNWYRNAAILGYSKAQRRLGELLKN